MNEQLLDVPAQAAIELDTPAFNDYLLMRLGEKKWSEISYEQQQKLVYTYIQRENGYTPEEIVL